MKTPTYYPMFFPILAGASEANKEPSVLLPIALIIGGSLLMAVWQTKGYMKRLQARDLQRTNNVYRSYMELLPKLKAMHASPNVTNEQRAKIDDFELFVKSLPNYNDRDFHTTDWSVELEKVEYQQEDIYWFAREVENSAQWYETARTEVPDLLTEIEGRIAKLEGVLTVDSAVEQREHLRLAREGLQKARSLYDQRGPDVEPDWCAIHELLGDAELSLESAEEI